MKNWHVFAYIGLGVLIGLINPVNSMIASILNPILTTVKGSYS